MGRPFKYEKSGISPAPNASTVLGNRTTIIASSSKLELVGGMAVLGRG